MGVFVCVLLASNGRGQGFCSISYNAQDTLQTINYPTLTVNSTKHWEKLGRNSKEFWFYISLWKLHLLPRAFLCLLQVGFLVKQTLKWKWANKVSIKGIIYGLTYVERGERRELDKEVELKWSSSEGLSQTHGELWSWDQLLELPQVVRGQVLHTYCWSVIRCGVTWTEPRLEWSSILKLRQSLKKSWQSRAIFQQHFQSLGK